MENMEETAKAVVKMFEQDVHKTRQQKEAERKEGFLAKYDEVIFVVKDCLLRASDYTEQQAFRERFFKEHSQLPCREIWDEASRQFKEVMKEKIQKDVNNLQWMNRWKTTPQFLQAQGFYFKRGFKTAWNASVRTVEENNEPTMKALLTKMLKEVDRQ
jgi:hypothetical protein